jgi:uncharacterized surface protein with fasciclin (FAS1) repeats
VAFLAKTWTSFCVASELKNPGFLILQILKNALQSKGKQQETMATYENANSDSDDDEPQSIGFVNAALLKAAEAIGAQPIQNVFDDSEWGFPDEPIAAAAAPVAAAAAPEKPAEKTSDHLFAMLAASFMHDEVAFAKASEKVGDIDEVSEELLQATLLRAHGLLTSGNQELQLSIGKPAIFKKLVRGFKTIAGLVKEKGEKKGTLATLLAAVTNPGQEKLLAALDDRKSKFILFAPYNDAFKGITDTQLADLLSKKKAPVLKKLLQGHVTSSQVSLDDIEKRVRLPMLSGDVITLKKTAGGLFQLFLEDKKIANVTIDKQTGKRAEYKVSNGTVILIDGVLLLPSIELGENFNYELASTGPVLQRKDTVFTDLAPPPPTDYQGMPGDGYGEVGELGPRQNQSDSPYGSLPRGAASQGSSPGQADNSSQATIPGDVASRGTLPPPLPSVFQQDNAEFSDDEDAAPTKKAWFSAPVTRGESGQFRAAASRAAPAAPAVAQSKTVSDDLLARLLKKK